MILNNPTFQEKWKSPKTSFLKVLAYGTYMVRLQIVFSLFLNFFNFFKHFGKIGKNGCVAQFAIDWCRSHIFEWVPVQIQAGLLSSSIIHHHPSSCIIMHHHASSSWIIILHQAGCSSSVGMCVPTKILKPNIQPKFSEIVEQSVQNRF